jgi:hypothetical protein
VPALSCSVTERARLTLETLSLILDGDVPTVISVVTLSLAIWASGCIGYAVGVWRTANRPVTAADRRPVFVNGQWHLPPMEDHLPEGNGVTKIVFAVKSQLLRKTKHWVPVFARSGRRTQARRLVELPTLSVGPSAGPSPSAGAQQERRASNAAVARVPEFRDRAKKSRIIRRSNTPR